MQLFICRLLSSCRIRQIKETPILSRQRKKGHTLEHCVKFIRTFDKKLQVEEILFQNEGALNIDECPFFSYNNNGKGKWQVMMVSSSEKDVE